ncbi:MAG TPA: hypothetical protein VK469_13750 [Candidatus Kapabacteria bacterium]|nr:hypothetical protein [Candidatus Kapabacteria bacterium]
MNKIAAILLLCLWLSMMHIMAAAQAKQETMESRKSGNQDKTLSYQVNVNVKILPVFAVDAQDNPVFDLEKEDMILYVNGEPRDIAYFKRYDFETGTIKKDKRIANSEGNERMVFIIVDTMFNSTTGFKRSKVIAGDIVKQGKPGDQFVVFENTIFGGLKLIANPDDSRENILKKIGKMKRPIERWASQLFSSRVLLNNIDFSIETEERLETEQWQSVRELHLDSESMRYRHQVEHFCRVLSQFKYILKTISTPKLVFLISEGMADGAFKMKLQGKYMPVDQVHVESDAELRRKKFETILVKTEKNVFEENQVYSNSLFRYLNEIIKSINYGGSVLHTINPARPNDTNDAGISGEMSLKYLAAESGGNYFISSDAHDIVKRIEKSVSAYYEMVFYIDTGINDNVEVELKCKREGIKVYTTGHAEGSKIYRDMDAVQKKMFALNVVTGGSWSRNSGKVMLIPFRRLEGEKKEGIYTLDIPLPNQMQNKKLDIFLIYKDPQTNRVDMNFVTKEVKNWVKIKIKDRRNEDEGPEQFFVIIEPQDAYCIYNKT